jgi:hypothetical protein
LRVAESTGGCDEVVARADPEAKAAWISARQAEGQAVLFVGDGLNDGPALQTARVGIAGTKFTARVAILGEDEDGTPVVPPGEEVAFLEPFPVEILTEDQEMRRRLRLLGIERVGDYRELPAASVAVQFGQEGRIAYQLALGVDDNPILGRVQPPTLEIQRTYWEPIDDLQYLWAEVDLLLGSLVAQLDEGGWMCLQVQLWLEFEADRSQEVKVQLDAPTVSLRELEGRVRPTLERQTYREPITGIRILLSRLTSLEGQQLSLETMSARQRVRLQRAVEHLRVKHGRGRIMMARLVNPRALLLSERFTLVEYEDGSKRGSR